MDRLEVLKKSDVFHLLENNDFKELLDMCTERVFQPGEIVIKQDKEVKELYVVEEGLVAILLEGGPLESRQIQTASNFQCFGWSATIPPYCSTATVKALEKTKALAFNGKRLRAMIYSNPALCAKIAGGIAEVISHRLRSAYTQLLGVTYQD